MVRTIGGAGSGAGQLQNPNGVAVDGAGNVYVSDYGGKRVVVFSAAGEVVRTIGVGQLTNPMGVAVDGAGNVYVSDDDGNRVVVFSAAGEVVRTFGAGQLTNPRGVAVDGAGSVFVSDYGNRVVVFSAAGEVVRTIGGPGSGAGQLRSPCGVAVDGDGNVLVAGRIVVFQGAAFPAAPGLPESVRPLLAGRDGAEQQRVLQDARVRAPLRALGDASARARGEEQQLAAARAECAQLREQLRRLEEELPVRTAAVPAHEERVAAAQGQEQAAAAALEGEHLRLSSRCSRERAARSSGMRA